ncbi:hypothetical protein ACPPVQ_02220 [Diaminobutyricibacter sp. McL0618]|uniref:hypothetical protein n=1 Tax=Leifsonia sp. McL0618 TaxID=3415677 RepID=UPI003CF2055C
MKAEISAPSLVGLGDELAAGRAYQGLGIASSRVEILRFVLSRSEVSTADVMREFCITRNGARNHLESLSAQNLVTVRHATHPRGSGPIRYWRANPPEVALLLDLFADYVFSAASP